MQVIHVAGVPPRVGSTILANIGWTAKSRAEPTKSVTENSSGNARFQDGGGGVVSIPVVVTVLTDTVGSERLWRRQEAAC